MKTVIIKNPLKPHVAGYLEFGEQPQKTIEYLVRIFKPVTVLDVGSGPFGGKKIFNDLGVQLVWCIDGDDQLLYRDEFMNSGHLKTFSVVDFERSSYRFPTTFDMVFSYECAEHILNADNYIETITANCGKILVITHALPGQRGYHHVNTQPDDYWISRIEKRGFKYLEKESMECRALGEGYFKMSGLFFLKI